jgi:hypothetical protein
MLIKKYTKPHVSKENISPPAPNTQRKKELGLEILDYVKHKPQLTKREKSPAPVLTQRKSRRDLESLVQIQQQRRQEREMKRKI